MPTENRSSNTELQQTEAAGAAMTQIRTMLGREQRPEQVAAALEACDWSDTPIGNKAIVLSAIRALRTMQSHPEPIAWMVGTAIWWTKEEAERDAAETGLPIVGLGPMAGVAPVEQHQGEPVASKKIHIEVRECESCNHIGIDDAHGTMSACHECEWSGPEPVEDKCPGCERENCMAASCPDCGSRYVLATSKTIEVAADPAEVGRLREALAEYKKAYSELEDQVTEDFKHIDDLRAQLAERDALLRDFCAHSALICGDLLRIAREDDCATTDPIRARAYAAMDHSRKVKKALSASAEPSAPFIHPVNMKTMMQAYEQVDHKAMLHGTSNWCAAMATALRGVLHAESSGPVEIDERAEFESVILGLNSRSDLKRKADGSYMNIYFESAWNGWQARAALECKQ